MIGRVAAPHSFLGIGLQSFNGHLLFLPSVLYLSQVGWFGLTGHAFVFAWFCLSLLTLSVALSAVLHALRVGLALAVACGVLLAYFGAAPQNMVFEWQMAWNFSLGFSLLSLLTVLRGESGPRTALVAALALVIAALWDSGETAVMIAMVFVFAIARWRTRWVLIAVAPAILLIGVWTLASGGEHLSSGPSSVWAACL